MDFVAGWVRSGTLVRFYEESWSALVDAALNL
jgi:hypothetical protein